MTEHYVWYASYGSNLLSARFDCYLKGTRIEGQRFGCAGARNAAAPVDVLSADVPHRLFFAREGQRWGRGGIAFLDPRPSPGASARLRMYKITLDQFNDVLAQENRLPVPPPPSIAVTPTHLDELRLTRGSVVSPSAYGYLKYLGNHEHCPILTFTCSPADARAADAGRWPWHFNMPSEAYANVIKSGLTESGMTQTQAQRYLWQALTPEPRHQELTPERTAPTYLAAT